MSEHSGRGGDYGDSEVGEKTGKVFFLCARVRICMRKKEGEDKGRAGEQGDIVALPRSM